MDSKTLVAALRECEKMLQMPRGVYVVHHAVCFTEAFPPALLSSPDLEEELADLVGLPLCLPSEEFPRSGRYPPHHSVRHHVRWMLGLLGSHAEVKKRARWAGFIAGAAARVYLPARYKRPDLIDVLDMHHLCSLAWAPGAPAHCLVHVGLGYLQGWPWADGQGSIDDFRRLNDPPLAEAS